MEMSDLYEKLAQDAKGEYPLFLGRVEVGLLYESLKDEKKKLKKEKKWTLNYDNQYFETCSYLECLLNKVKALYRVVEDDERLARSVVEYEIRCKVTPSQEADDLPF